MNRAPVRSLDYVALSHPDEDARAIAALIVQFADDPWELVERIAEWARAACECEDWL